MSTSDTKTLKELDLLNYFLNLLKDTPHPGVLNILKNQQYQLFSIEKNVRTDKGTVKFDLCMMKENEFFGLELKGGYIDNDLLQLEKYATFDRRNYLRDEAVANVHDDNFNIHIVFDDMLNQTRNRTYECLTYTGYNTRNNKVQFSCHSNIFSIINTYSETVDLEAIYPIVHFDKESSDIEIAREICVEVDAYLMSNNSFTIDEIFHQSFCSIPDFLNTLGADVKKFGQKKILKMLNNMAETGYKKLMKWEHGMWKPAKEINFGELKKARIMFLNSLIEPSIKLESIDQITMDEYIDLNE